MKIEIVLVKLGKFSTESEIFLGNRGKSETGGNALFQTLKTKPDLPDIYSMIMIIYKPLGEIEVAYP